MRHREWFRHGLLRIQLRFFSPLFVGVFFLFCVFVICTVFRFLKLGHLQMLSVTSCLLYLTTQYSSYYLLYAPCMMILLSGLNEMGAFELLLYARFTNRKAYDVGQLFAIFLFVVLCVFGSASVAGAVYCFASNPEADWRMYCQYLQSRGMYLVSGDFAQLPGALAVFVQLTMSTLSFYALGLFLMFLRNLFQKAFLVLIVGLSTNFLFLLALKNDLPDQLFSALPYTHLFLPYLKSLTDFQNAVIYWLCVIVFLHLAVWLSSRLRDWVLTDYEK